MISDKEGWADFCAFAKATVLAGDDAPAFALLRRSYALAKLPPDIALWRSLIFLTWFHLGSAETVWTAHPSPGSIDEDRFAALPTGVERRSFRGLVGNRGARAFIAAVRARSGGSLLRWVTASGTGTDGWERARRELQSVAGAGAWASYQWVAVARSIHGFPIEAPALDASGAIATLAGFLGKEPKALRKDKALQRAALREAVSCGAPLSGLDDLERCLVAFAELRKGARYVGHDIDAQMDELKRGSSRLWKARDVFPKKLLGELGDPRWFGVRKELKKVYAQRREIVNL